jgi:hypothetical protein
VSVPLLGLGVPRDGYLGQRRLAVGGRPGTHLELESKFCACLGRLKAARPAAALGTALRGCRGSGRGVKGQAHGRVVPVTLMAGPEGDPRPTG